MRSWPHSGQTSNTNLRKALLAFTLRLQQIFLNGGYFPVGGFQTDCNSSSQGDRGFRWKVSVNHEVKEIRVENGRVCGVTALNKGEEIEFNAPIVISNAGAVTTFGKLVPKSSCGKEREIVARLKPGTSAIHSLPGLKGRSAQAWFR